MKNRKTILVVDDCEDNIEIIQNLLTEYHHLGASSGNEAIELLQHTEVDLILLDIMMPGLDGYETCQKIKQIQKNKDTPVIFITAKTDDDSIERAYEFGGVDYITKPIKPKELKARVRTQLKMQNLISTLERFASYDSMTGVYNRRKFFELGDAAFSNTGQSMVAMILDIDNFKQVNDVYGHNSGDKVIKKTAKVLQKWLDEDAILGRLGGEEFGIVCPEIAWDKAVLLAENIRESMHEAVTIAENGIEITVSISIGFTEKTPEHRNLDALLASADKLLYEAKRTGRNRAVSRQTSR